MMRSTYVCRCTSVSITRTGWMPGLRVWKLVAYDSDTVVAAIEEDCGSNDIKFRKFCQMVTKEGYSLTDGQVQDVCSALALYVRTDKVEMSEDPFSQDAIFQPEWEAEFLKAQFQPAHFQTWLTLVTVLFVVVSASVLHAKLGDLPDDCTCHISREDSMLSRLYLFFDCRRGRLGLILCVPFSLAMKLVIYCIPLEYYKNFHTVLVVLWVTVTYGLNVTGDVVRDVSRSAGNTAYTLEDLALYPNLAKCLSISHIVYGNESHTHTCHDTNPFKTMTMTWPWPDTHGCENIVFSPTNISGFCQFQLVVIFLHLDVTASIMQNVLCAAILVVAVQCAGIHDTLGLVHSVALHLFVGMGVSVGCYVERQKARKQVRLVLVVLCVYVCVNDNA